MEFERFEKDNFDHQRHHCEPQNVLQAFQSEQKGE